jgi:hypothetical protein
VSVFLSACVSVSLSLAHTHYQVKMDRKKDAHTKGKFIKDKKEKRQCPDRE